MKGLILILIYFTTQFFEPFKRDRSDCQRGLHNHLPVCTVNLIETKKEITIEILMNNPGAGMFTSTNVL